jgi:hypothetical protein
MTPHERMEEELRQALRRQDAPEGFAERVLTRAIHEPAHGLWSRFVRVMHTPALRFATAAVLCVAVVGGSLEYRRYRQDKRAGEAAKQQLMLALRITGSKLHYVQAKVNGSTQQFGPEQEIEEERQ